MTLAPGMLTMSSTTAAPSLEGQHLQKITPLKIQPIPYQGSKRALAPVILEHAPRNVDTLYEPFAGSAAFTLLAATNKVAKHYVIGDALHDLIELWKMIVSSPEATGNAYKLLWLGQKEDDQGYYNRIRSEYNADRDPIKLLYLITRCVKNAVRFGKKGDFTQSHDKRRLGVHPERMAESISYASHVLKGKVTFFSGDFRDCLQGAHSGDLVYMDPPYQGTTYGRDKRYFQGLQSDDLADVLRSLNQRDVRFLLSYDGMTGGVEYGQSLPQDIKARRIFLNAGRSSQATLIGKDSITVESLYISSNLQPEHKHSIVEKQVELAF